MKNFFTFRTVSTQPSTVATNSLRISQSLDLLQLLSLDDGCYHVVN